MKYFIILILCTNIVFSETLFQVKDSSDRVVLDVSSDGLRVLNEGDTVMVISSTEIKAVIDNSKALSRSFTVATSTSAKGQANVMEVTTDATTMREGNAGEIYTDFSPENMFLGLNAGSATTPTSTYGRDNVFIGNYSGWSNTDGRQNIFIGKDAGYNNTGGDGCTMIGYKAGYNSVSSVNVYVGNGSGYSNSSGGFNTYLGNSAGYYQASGSENVYLGNASGMYKTGGNNNTILGTGAGMTNQSGLGNVFLGYYAGANETGSNKLYIANSDTSTPLIHGDFTNNTLGLGIQASSTYRLDVRSTTNSGNFQSSTTKGTSTRGLYARASGGTSSNYGIYASASGTGAINYAGYFSGNINVTGTVVKSKDEVKSDHPTDPENKILTHSSVSSSEMLNVYSGNVILNGDGKAIVEMPEWFEAYNAEFRYQLTGIGISAPGLFISEELTKGRFSIGGGNPDMKVSWMVTAVRNDNYAKANPMQVVSEKKENEKGYYLTPEVFGKSKDMSIESVNEREAVKNIPE